MHHSVATLDSFSNPNIIFVRYYVYLFETLLRHKIWIFFVKDGKRYLYYIHCIRCLIHTNDTFFIQLYYRWFNRIELDPIIQNSFHSSELLVMQGIFWGKICSSSMDHFCHFSVTYRTSWSGYESGILNAGSFWKLKKKITIIYFFFLF